jgi:hypothetical protein
VSLHEYNFTNNLTIHGFLLLLLLLAFTTHLRVLVSSFLRFLDHIQRHTIVCTTPLDEWSARRRDLYMTTHNTHNRQTSMPSAGFELSIPAGERLQIHVLDRSATGIGNTRLCAPKMWTVTTTVVVNADSQCVIVMRRTVLYFTCHHSQNDTSSAEVKFHASSS